MSQPHKVFETDRWLDYGKNILHVMIAFLDYWYMRNLPVVYNGNPYDPLFFSQVLLSKYLSVTEKQFKIVLSKDSKIITAYTDLKDVYLSHYFFVSDSLNEFLESWGGEFYKNMDVNNKSKLSLIILNAFVIHETAHIKYTPPELTKYRKKNDKLWSIIANIVADHHIEGIVQRKWQNHYTFILLANILLLYGKSYIDIKANGFGDKTINSLMNFMICAKLTDQNIKEFVYNLRSGEMAQTLIKQADFDAKHIDEIVSLLFKARDFGKFNDEWNVSKRKYKINKFIHIINELHEIVLEIFPTETIETFTHDSVDGGGSEKGEDDEDDEENEGKVKNTGEPSFFGEVKHVDEEIQKIIEERFSEESEFLEEFGDLVHRKDVIAKGGRETKIPIIIEHISQIQPNSYRREIIKNPEMEEFSHYIRAITTVLPSTSPLMDVGSKLDKWAMHRIITDKKIFRFPKMATRKLKYPQILWFVDASGSTGGGLIEKEISSVWGAFSSCVNIGIRNAVWAHTSSEHTSQQGVYLVNVASHNMPNHMGVVVTQTIENYDKAFQRMGELILEENYDGHAIEAVCGFFGKVGQKILIHLSDGMPSGRNYHGTEHTTKSIERMRQQGVLVYSYSVVESVVESNNEIYGDKFNIAAYGELLDEELRRFVQNIVKDSQHNPT